MLAFLADYRIDSLCNYVSQSIKTNLSLPPSSSSPYPLPPPPHVKFYSVSLENFNTVPNLFNHILRIQHTSQLQNSGVKHLLPISMPIKPESRSADASSANVHSNTCLAQNLYILIKISLQRITLLFKELHHVLKENTHTQ